MTLAENIMLIIQEYQKIDRDQALELASLKLALVGLAGFEDYYPSEISGGMKKGQYSQGNGIRSKFFS